MADPDISSEPGKFQEVAKAASELQQAADGYTAYTDLERQLREAKAMLKESQGEAPRCWIGTGQSAALRRQHAIAAARLLHICDH